MQTCVSVHRRDRCTGVSSSQGYGVVACYPCTCVSVHRCDRCTRTFLHYFGPAPLFHVHAPPPCAMILNCTTPVTKVKRTGEVVGTSEGALKSRSGAPSVCR